LIFILCFAPLICHGRFTHDREKDIERGDETLLPYQCRGTTVGGTRCLRKVSSGASLCWQHARGIRAKYASLSRNQQVVFAVSLLGVILTVVFFFIQFKQPQSHSSVTDVHVESHGDNSPNVVNNDGEVQINSRDQNKKQGAPTKK
jgi:hypothetical protein